MRYHEYGHGLGRSFTKIKIWQVQDRAIKVVARFSQARSLQGCHTTRAAHSFGNPVQPRTKITLTTDSSHHQNYTLDDIDFESF